MATAYQLYGVKINTTVVGGITNQRVNPGIETLIQGGSGSVDPTWGGILKSEPVLSFSTCQVATALGLCGIGGYEVGTVEFGFIAIDSGGTRGSTYLKVVPYGGLVVPRRISASHNKEATIDFDVFAIGDASNAPIAVSATSMTYTTSVAEKFTTGPVSVNSTAYEVQSLNIDSGINVGVIGHSGIPWPTSAYIQTREPEVSIETMDLGKGTALYSGTSPGLTLTALVVYLRKMAEGGSARIANATAEHIKLTMTQGPMTIQEIGGDHGSESRLQITAKPVYDGTNAIIQQDLASAIS